METIIQAFPPGKIKKMAAGCDDFLGDGNYRSGISPVKMKKMAAGCDDFWVIFGRLSAFFSQVCYPSLHNNGN